MSCVFCFFSPGFQKNLQRETFCEPRFEKRLELYKQKYIEKIDSLSPVDSCNCRFLSESKKDKNKLVYRISDGLLSILKNNHNNILDFFDSLIEIYIEYIQNGVVKSTEKFCKFLTKENIFSSIPLSPIELSVESRHPFDIKLLYRAREKTGQKFSGLDLFHVPFNLRNKISNNRFSVSGQPMLYLSKSVIGAEKEVGLPYKKLQFKAFLPRFSRLEDSTKIYKVSYRIYNHIVAGLHLYDDSDNYNFGLEFDDVKKDILTNILCYPFKKKNEPFVEEYALPQIFVSILNSNGFIGIEYPSSRLDSIILDYNIYSRYDENIAFFVKYSRAEDYDIELRKMFIEPELVGGTIKISEKECLKKIASTRSFLEKIDFNICSDYKVPLFQEGIHLCEMQDLKTNRKSYFKTKEGVLELNFVYQLCEDAIKRFEKV